METFYLEQISWNLELESLDHSLQAVRREACRELLRMKVWSSTGSALQRPIFSWTFSQSQVRRFGKLVVGVVYWSRGDRQTKGPHNDFNRLVGPVIAWYPSVKPCRAGDRPGQQLTSVEVGTSAPLSGRGLDGTWLWVPSGLFRALSSVQRSTDR